MPTTLWRRSVTAEDENEEEMRQPAHSGVGGGACCRYVVLVFYLAQIEVILLDKQKSKVVAENIS